MLEINDLRYSYAGETQMDMKFDLSVTAGEVLSLIGPSGAGKSTLLNLIAGFLQPRSGEILVDGNPIQSQSSAERPVSMVFQQNNLFPHLDLYTNVGLGVNPSMRLNADQCVEIDAAFQRLGLDGLQRRKPGEISGGQRQRTALARVLVRDRKILLLDEAFAALGPAQRQEMIGLVAGLVKEKEMAALLISHQPRDAQVASQRLAFVENGQIAVVDSTEKMLLDASHAGVREYLGLE